MLATVSSSISVGDETFLLMWQLRLVGSPYFGSDFVYLYKFSSASLRTSLFHNAHTLARHTACCSGKTHDDVIHSSFFLCKFVFVYKTVFGSVVEY